MAKKKKNKVLYRIENKHGIGPYQITTGGMFARKPYYSDRALMLSHSHADNNLHPEPAYSGHNPAIEEVFGFSSPKKLLEWFTIYELRKIVMAKYKIHRYVGEVVFDDGKQVSFNKNFAKKGRSYSLKEFLQRFGD